MTTPKVHCLTVGSGDCTIIQHSTGRATMIDICGGNKTSKKEEQGSVVAILEKAAAASNAKGNFRMCEKPTHPFDYLHDLGVQEIWRFILTHPDMDHLDGFDGLMDEFNVINFWDTGARKTKPEFKDAPYNESDWDRYTKVRDGGETNTKSIRKLDGEKFEFANKGGDNDNGDCLHIAAPSKKLVEDANSSQEFNDSSYIIVYRMGGGKVVIAGDAENGAFDHAIATYPDLMKDVGFLLAPHHGRDSGRDYSFLDHLNPRYTLLGCAPHVNHKTSSWSNRGLDYCKQNQCGNMIVQPSSNNGMIDIFIENEKFAEKSGGDTSKKNDNGYYFLKSI